MKDKLIHKKS